LRYTETVGDSWYWQLGKYVAAPPGSSAWMPGSRQQQAGGGWTWVSDRWSLLHS